MYSVKAVAELFLEDCPGLLGEIHTAQSTRDQQTLEWSAHRLKGAAANLSASRVSDVAQRLEDIGRGGGFAEADVTCAELETELRLLECALEGLESEVPRCES